MLFFCYYFELAKKTTLNSNIFINRLYHLLSGLCIIINYNIKQCDGTTYGHMLSLVPKFIISKLSGGRTRVGLKKKTKYFRLNENLFKKSVSVSISFYIQHRDAMPYQVREVFFTRARLYDHRLGR